MRHTIAKNIAKHALTSMLSEVYTTPKPGLVDSNDSGAHKDMSLDTFIKSSWSLLPTMHQCALAGIENSHKAPEDTLPVLRGIGKAGEKAMFNATNNINTQKGLLFVLGIMCATIGRIQNINEETNIDNIIQTIKEMTKGIVSRELGNFKKKNGGSSKYTAGEILYIKYGIEGIRGEVERGLPSVVNYGLPQLVANLKQGLSFNDSAVNTILFLMTVVEDTNVIWRTGMEGLNLMRTRAKEVIDLGGISTKKGREAILVMNEDFIRKNISAGGCADLLATTIMVYLTLQTPPLFL